MKQAAFMCFVLVWCSVLHVPAVLAVVKGAVLCLSGKKKTLTHSPVRKSKFIRDAMFKVFFIHYPLK